MDHQLISNQLSSIATQTPDKLIQADNCGCKNISFAEFEKRVNDLSKGLLIRNINPNSKVLLFVQDDRATVESFLALTKIGVKIYTTKSQALISEMIKELNIDTVLFPIDITVDLFKKEQLAKQNRDFLSLNDFPSLAHIISLEPIKLRGAYNLQELILLGKHIDDLELEEVTFIEQTPNYSIVKTEVANSKFKLSGIPIEEIFMEEFPFFDLKKL